ncbi:Rieske 2Fe-2S domain-containing protein [Pseudooceanicola sp. CBS1P-1]|uniref:Rieske 2Fe-2S domain-containing protein n=1 Tax=Pseudooceanicola TaxID=1679449 RepID=UPI0019285A32|nr:MULTISPECIES: Rieske 2Fe-2S domain-containing protein [Pseudooceanicola]MBT9384482.1 Rieske 2Fe-2S domain-containing protein [Pseudooceanicola endophyticus]
MTDTPRTPSQGTPPQWTPVALSRDLAPATAIPVIAEGTELALWRGRSGRLAAWHDRCPHRGMRLSQGFVRDDMLSCLYHGWRYDLEGQCRKIPAHPELEPNKAICVPAWSVTEATGIIWVSETGSGAPPDTGALAPLRSLTVERSEDALRDHLGDGVVIEFDGLHLLLQGLPQGRCVLHALTGPGLDAAGQRAASHRLEALRTRFEDSEDIA